MHFDLTDLRLFLHVQEAGTITGGAAASHMTLASASERTRGMEDSLGSPLLSRARRGVQLTPAGRTLAHHAQLVLRQIDQLQGELGDYGAGIKGHVRLLCNSSALAVRAIRSRISRRSGPTAENLLRDIGAVGDPHAVRMPR